jgi:hypothetical protein
MTAAEPRPMAAAKAAVERSRRRVFFIGTLALAGGKDLQVNMPALAKRWIST